jgi:50S ribosomal subunit-associated GTPase HflX
VAILVASVVDSNSFDSIDRWVELLGDANEELPPIVLAVNKIDVADRAPKSLEQIGNELHDKFAGLFFVSAATGEQVANLFLFAAQVGLHFLEAGESATVQTVLDADDDQRKCY